MSPGRELPIGRENSPEGPACVWSLHTGAPALGTNEGVAMKCIYPGCKNTSRTRGLCQLFAQSRLTRLYEMKTS